MGMFDRSSTRQLHGVANFTDSLGSESKFLTLFYFLENSRAAGKRVVGSPPGIAPLERSRHAGANISAVDVRVAAVATV